MRQTIRRLLERANLREEEIRIYLLLLKLQSAGIPELITKSKQTSITTYRTIDRLINRGLVQAVPMNKKQQIYKPLSLKALVQTLETKQRELQQLEKSLRNLDPLLPYMNLNEDAEDDAMSIVEGADLFCQSYLDIADKHEEEFLAIGSSENFWAASGTSIDSPVERSFVSRRLRNNMYSRILMVACDDAEQIASNDTKELRTTKQKQTLPVMNDCLMICGDQVSHFLCDPENPRVVTMKNPQFVALQKNYFEYIWKQ